MDLMTGIELAAGAVLMQRAGLRNGKEVARKRSKKCVCTVAHYERELLDVNCAVRLLV